MREHTRENGQIYCMVHFKHTDKAAEIDIPCDEAAKEINEKVGK